jgi:hypothetical protein
MLTRVGRDSLEGPKLLDLLVFAVWLVSNALRNGQDIGGLYKHTPRSSLLGLSRDVATGIIRSSDMGGLDDMQVILNNSITIYDQELIPGICRWFVYKDQRRHI